MGVKTRTRGGFTCQRWDSNSPHSHHYKRDHFYPEGNITLAENYCRNPDLNWGEGLWCFTSNSRKRWDHCDVPFCNCKQKEEGTEFRGSVTGTSSGKSCQDWFTQTPHSHNFSNISFFPDRRQQEVANNCRNPVRVVDGAETHRERPWCFTTDPDTEWEYCDVPSCVVRTTTQPNETTTASTATAETSPSTGSAIVTSATATPPTTTVWPQNPTQPGDVSECRLVQGGYRYQGVRTKTRRGYTCQRWDSNSPHSHHYKQDNLYPEGNITLAENYCRNPDLNWGEGLWCYTTTSRKRWDQCDIPYCNCKQSETGYEFRGSISTSRSGKVCQNWFSQTPHTHNYTNTNSFPDKTRREVGNNCRNPDTSKDRPWCFTTDPNTVWEYCDIPFCTIPSTTPISSTLSTQPLRTTLAQSLRMTTFFTSTRPEPSRSTSSSTIPTETDKPPKQVKQKSGISGGLVASVVVPIIILLTVGAIGGFVIFYYRGRLCPVRVEKMKEDVEPPTGHFDNPLYGQMQKNTETDT